MSLLDYFTNAFNMSIDVRLEGVVIAASLLVAAELVASSAAPRVEIEVFTGTQQPTVV